MQKREKRGIIAKKKVVMTWGGERERVCVYLVVRVFKNNDNKWSQIALN